MFEPNGEYGVKAFTALDSDNTYHPYDIDLSGFPMSSQFFVAFDAGMSSRSDYWYIDDVEFVSTGPANDPPVANPQAATTAEDASKAITLTGSDVDGDALTFSVVSGPSNGSLSGTAPNLTYTPSLNYNGSDNFTFRVNDGYVDSAPATVSITVTPVNDPPVANPQSVATKENTPVDIILTGSDVDGNSLTYSVVSGPSSGTLSGTAPNLTYTPSLNYNGPDSFTFTVNDGAVDSAPATVSITVTANNPPVANAQAVTTAEDTAVSIVLTGSDADGDPLTCSVVSGPSSGTLSGIGPNLTYTPNLNYNGPDSFTFTVNDGTVDSNVATVGLTVNPLAPTMTLTITKHLIKAKLDSIVTRPV